MERGDIFNVDLEPTGREQRGRRPVIVVTTKEFNHRNPPIVCPVTRSGEFARLKGFTVSLAGTGMKTDGVVLCSQPRTLDISARRGKRIEHAPDSIIDEVLAALQDILE